MENNIHKHLAGHMSMMGLPLTQGLVDILKENFSAEEAEIVLLLPATDIPLKPVSIDKLVSSGNIDDPVRVKSILEDLVKRKLIFTGKAENGEKGYALHQAGFGFPQSFFWDGNNSPYAQKMTKLVIKYFNRDVTKEAFGGGDTKPYRYIPIQQSLKPELQAVLPHDIMENVLDNARRFAVAHCTCRVQAGLLGRACEHPLEVCMKFDEMADYIIEQELGREITRKEAGDIIDTAKKAGLVHFVDNAAGDVKHNCNCCGCACWNVGTIRRRKIPRDDLMAVYFTRQTDSDLCTGCGECIDICPVDVITIENGVAKVDEDWCIGCGVCASQCDFDAVNIVYREDTGKDKNHVLKDFETLHNQIRAENKTKQA